MSIEYSAKKGNQDTSGQEPASDNENKWKVGVEIPFINESYITVNREMTSRSGRRVSQDVSTVVALKGEPVKGASIQVSYKADRSSDAENPQADRSDSQLNIVFKMESKW